MRGILVAFSLLALAGCQTQTNNSKSDLILNTQPNSQQRLTECLNTYKPKTLEFRECWEGKRVAKSEVCANAGAFLNNPWASDWQKMAMYERMRNAGCMN